ncbi:MAG: GNAT family N-acetyltransferase [Phycisphaerae bacterium]
MSQDPFVMVRPQTPEQVRRGLACLVGGPVPGDPELAARHAARVREAIARFVNYAREIGLRTDRQVQAVRPPVSDQAAVLGVCLWVPATGRTAMLFAPPMTEHPTAAGPTVFCIRAALQDVAADTEFGGINLVQAVLDPQDEIGHAMFEQAGLHVLTTLEYMERRAPLLPPTGPAAITQALPAGVRLEIYRPENHALFAAAIQASYQQTLDCPALSGLRDIEDVIAGHKAVGTFDPALWFLMLEKDQPVGCLLLARIPSRQAMDLVYLGLAPAARGRGLSRALMQMLMYQTRQQGCTICSLSVDEINVPARKLYQRFGFSVVARRRTMICQLPVAASGADGSPGKK